MKHIEAKKVRHKYLRIIQVTTNCLICITGRIVYQYSFKIQLTVLSFETLAGSAFVFSVETSHSTAGNLESRSSGWPKTTSDFAFAQELGGVGIGEGDPGDFLDPHQHQPTGGGARFSVAQPLVAELRNGGVDLHVAGVSSTLDEVRK